MDPERWEQLRAIVQPALELEAGDVEPWLERSCGNDAELRREVERLLRACREAEGSLQFLNSPAAELAGPFLQAPAPSEEHAEPLGAGADLGPYTIERQIGRGGMGVVFLARDRRLDRRVALKLLPPWLAATEDAVRRFAREAQAASRIDHPNIATVYEVGESPDGRLYIAMAYYEGETLQERIARGPLELNVAVGLAAQIADGLGAAHARGIVHRDIKPGNVMVTPEGLAKILDFGAAKIAGHQLTGPGTALGTVAYMSPEQTRREEVDARSDVWSVGVVLFELLAGRRPFAAQHAEAVIHAIRHDELPPIGELVPGVSEGVGEVLRRCLARDPALRYRDGAELAAELRRLRDGLPPRRERRWRRVFASRRRAAALVALVFVVSAIWLVRVRSGLRGSVLPGESTILVMPLLPATEDTGLRRLGRELAVTLGNSLDGVGGLRTIEATTVLSLVPEGDDRTLEHASELAVRLGARNVLRGSLVREDRNVRLEFGLFDAVGRRLLARATAVAPANHIGAVTDSATLAILHEVWRGRKAPAPNPVAITTRSLPALRAYLEGELAFARSDFDRAVPAFERAYAADSTFALAYWRSLYPRIYEGSRPDSGAMAALLRHRDRFPDPERLMVDAYTSERLSERIALVRTVTERFIEYWPGWYELGNQLFHRGPYLGTTYADAQAALERVVALNPDFAVASQHILWTAAQQRDTLAADRALAVLERFAAPDAFMYHPVNMMYFRSLNGLIRSGGEFSEPEASRLAQAVLKGGTRVPSAENVAINFLLYGYPRAQIRLADAVLRAAPVRRTAAAWWMGKAFTWAGRGGWDSALVAAGEWLRLSDDDRSPLLAYGLATLGAVFGAVEPARARRWRPEPDRDFTLQSADAMAELAWLDGILAYAAGDRPALSHAQRFLAGSAAQHAQLLTTSLHAFGRHAAGDGPGAARALSALEWDFAERDAYGPWSRLHPFLSAIHRPAASRWVLETGDTLQAIRLLSWHEAIFGLTMVHAANRVAAPLALYQRARLEEARGRVEEARRHYRGFLDRYDLPPARHVAMTSAARDALRRLERSSLRAPARAASPPATER